MIKIKTLFKIDYNNSKIATREVNEGCEWVINGEGVARRKWDGSACAMVKGVFYKRFDLKEGRKKPKYSIPCQSESDSTTGHFPLWVKCDRDEKSEKWLWKCFDHFNFNDLDENLFCGEIITFEAVGTKINSNNEKLDYHTLIPHKMAEVYEIERTYDGIKKFLETKDIEGIVFHHPDGRMCKIRKVDFGLKRS